MSSEEVFESYAIWVDIDGIYWVAMVLSWEDCATAGFEIPDDCDQQLFVQFMEDDSCSIIGLSNVAQFGYTDEEIVQIDSSHTNTIAKIQAQCAEWWGVNEQGNNEATLKQNLLRRVRAPKLNSNGSKSLQSGGDPYAAGMAALQVFQYYDGQIPAPFDDTFAHGKWICELSVGALVNIELCGELGDRVARIHVALEKLAYNPPPFAKKVALILKDFMLECGALLSNFQGFDMEDESAMQRNETNPCIAACLDAQRTTTEFNRLHTKLTTILFNFKFLGSAMFKADGFAVQGPSLQEIRNDNLRAVALIIQQSMKKSGEVPPNDELEWENSFDKAIAEAKRLFVPGPNDANDGVQLLLQLCKTTIHAARRGKRLFLNVAMVAEAVRKIEECLLNEFVPAKKDDVELVQNALKEAQSLFEDQTLEIPKVPSSFSPAKSGTELPQADTFNESEVPDPLLEDARSGLPLMSFPKEWLKTYSHVSPDIVCHMFVVAYRISSHGKPVERVIFVTDQTLFVGEAESERVTRCVQINTIGSVATDTATGRLLAIRIPFEYDIVLQLDRKQRRDDLVGIFSRIYKRMTGGNLLQNIFGNMAPSSFNLEKPKGFRVVSVPQSTRAALRQNYIVAQKKIVAEAEEARIFALKASDEDREKMQQAKKKEIDERAKLEVAQFSATMAKIYAGAAQLQLSCLSDLQTIYERVKLLK